MDKIELDLDDNWPASDHDKSCVSSQQDSDSDRIIESSPQGQVWQNMDQWCTSPVEAQDFNPNEKRMKSMLNTFDDSQTPSPMFNAAACYQMNSDPSEVVGDALQCCMQNWPVTSPYLSSVELEKRSLRREDCSDLSTDLFSCLPANNDLSTFSHENTVGSSGTSFSQRSSVDGMTYVQYKQSVDTPGPLNCYSFSCIPKSWDQGEQLFENEKNSSMNRERQDRSGLSDEIETELECSCDEIGDAVPVEQLFCLHGQMVRLPHVTILQIGEFHLCGFLRKDGWFVSLTVFYLLLPKEEQFIFKSELERASDLLIRNGDAMESEFLKQSYKLTDIEITELIAVESIHLVSQRLFLIYEDHLVIKALATGLYLKKILGGNVRCSNCGLLLRKQEGDYGFEPLSPIGGEGGGFSAVSFSNCTTLQASIGKVNSCHFVMTGFLLKGMLYLPLKQLVSPNLFKLRVLQRRLSKISAVPIPAPKELEARFPLLPLCRNTLWISVDDLRCICWLPKAITKKTPAIFALACGQYAYKETMVLQIGQKSTLENAIYTVHSGTLEIQLESQDNQQKDTDQ